MKIKLDFITNSSSSSFIVVWPYRIKSVEDINKFIYNKTHSQILFDQIKSQKPLTKKSKKLFEKIAEIIKSGHIPELSYSKHRKEFIRKHGLTEDEFQKKPGIRDLFYMEEEYLASELALQKTEKFLEEFNDNEYIYIFNISDETSIGADMEHGNIFYKLKHYQANKH